MNSRKNGGRRGRRAGEGWSPVTTLFNDNGEGIRKFSERENGVISAGERDIRGREEKRKSATVRGRDDYSEAAISRGSSEATTFGLFTANDGDMCLWRMGRTTTEQDTVKTNRGRGKGDRGGDYEGFRGGVTNDDEARYDEDEQGEREGRQRRRLRGFPWRRDSGSRRVPRRGTISTMKQVHSGSSDGFRTKDDDNYHDIDTAYQA